MAARFTRAELQTFHGSMVDDLVAPRTRVLFVGINPGLWTAAARAHFARRGNRFWPALHAAGITPTLVDASDGMQPADLRLLARLGVGITNIVPTASARADELTRDELRAGAAALEEKVAAMRPRPKVVAVLGLTAYRQAFAPPEGATGPAGGAPWRRRTVGAAQPEWPQRPRHGAQPGGRVPGGVGGSRMTTSRGRRAGAR